MIKLLAAESIDPKKPERIYQLFIRLLNISDVNILLSDIIRVNIAYLREQNDDTEGRELILRQGAIQALSELTNQILGAREALKRLQMVEIANPVKDLTP